MARRRRIFSGVIEVRDKAGRMVADAVDGEGGDVAATFAAAAGRIFISVRDLTTAGIGRSCID
jgi:hypothetical protein